MAVIQKIRDKYAKLAGAIIALALVGFILMDAASGRFGDLFGHDSSVAKINGEKIESKDFSQREKEYETLYAYSTQGKSPDENTRAQINDEVMRDMLNEKLIKDISDKVGILSTKEEEKDMIYGPIPDPSVQQYPYFTNPDTKQFDPQRVKAFEQQVGQIDPSGKLSEQWEALKSYIIRANLSRKFTAALTKNVYVPKFLMDFQQKEQNEMASIKYLKVPYTSIPDEQVSIKDEDLTEYMKKHPGMYSSDEMTRNIEYVVFDVIPTAEDTARALGVLTQLKPEFEKTADNESFVNRNSEEPFKDAFVNKASFMSMYTDSILSRPTGTVYGPYFEGGVYKMTKILDKKTLPDSVKCRHILVKTKANGQDVAADSIAKKKLDSAIAMLNSGADFNSVVQKYSEDDGSKQTQGEYTFTLQQRPNLSKEFGDFVFDGKTGEKKTVKVENSSYAGYHYIEILDQKAVQTAAKLAVVSKSLYAGDNTVNAVFAKANEFAGKNGGSEKAFDDAVKAQNINKRLGENIKVNDFMVAGIGPSREIVRWVYEAKPGDISNVFQLDGRYIIVKMAGEQQPGLMKLNAALKPSIEAQVRIEKKAEKIMSKYSSMNNIDAIATAATQPVQQLDTFNAAMQFVANLGYEPKVTGYAFYKGLKQGSLSPAIKGQDGVFYEVLVNKMEIPVRTDPAIQQQKISMQENQMRNAASSLLDMIRKNAHVKYNPKNL